MGPLPGCKPAYEVKIGDLICPFSIVYRVTGIERINWGMGIHFQLRDNNGEQNTLSTDLYLQIPIWRERDEEDYPSEDV